MSSAHDGRGDARERAGGAFAAGLAACLPILLAVMPFGFVFGVFAAELGLGPAQATVMAATANAGASQMAALQVLADDAPVAMAVLAGAVVNLRFAMYSASLAVVLADVPIGWRLLAAPFVHDQTFALVVRRAGRRPEERHGRRLSYFFGIGVLLWSCWTASAYAGASLGREMAGEIDIAFMVPVTFIAVAAPLIRGRANIAAALVAAAVALVAHGLPHGAGLIAGTAAGIAAGMLISRAKDGA